MMNESVRYKRHRKYVSFCDFFYTSLYKDKRLEECYNSEDEQHFNIRTLPIILIEID